MARDHSTHRQEQTTAQLEPPNFCDLVLDVIARKDTEPAGGVRLSRPYHRSGVVLAVRNDSRASSLATLDPDQRVGVPVGSLVSMILDKGGIVTTPSSPLRGSRVLQPADGREVFG